MKTKLVLCVLMLTAVAGARAETAGAVTLHEPGKPPAKIYLQEDWSTPATPTGTAPDVGYYEQQARHRAVADLQSYLEQMSGAKIEVVQVTSPSQVQKPAIVLGKLAAAMDTPAPKPVEMGEGYRIHASDGLVRIAGNSGFGMEYGAYAFLESLGCAWVFPGTEGDVVPSLATVRVPVSDRSVEPAFSLRVLGMGSKVLSKDQKETVNLWSIRNGFTDTNLVWLYPFALRNGHFWSVLVQKYKDVFAAHPEMLALARQPDGSLRRSGPQVESTDPRVVDLIVKFIDQTFAQNKWHHDKEVCFSVGPADGSGFSESVESLTAMDGQIDPLIGEPDRTALVVLLANQVFAKIKANYPNVYLGEYLYNVHGGFQTRYPVDSHFVVVVADITYSRYASALDHSSPSRNLYRNILNQWHQLKRTQGNPMYFRGYDYNLADCMLPYDRAVIWGSDMPYYHDNGYLGFSIEAVPSYSVSAASDYVLSKIAWDPSVKWTDALHDFSVHAFGEKADPFMEKYFVTQAELQRKSHVETGSYWGIRAIYPPSFVSQAKELFAQADGAAENPREKKLIHYFTYPVEYLDLFLQLFAARDSFDFARTKDLLADLHATLARATAENPFITSDHALKYLDRFWSKPVEDAARYSSGAYAIEARVPERMNTYIDQLGAGERMELYRPEIDTTRYLQTSTYTTSWSEQGLGGLGNGTVWYFFRFHLNAPASPSRIGAFFGTVDGTSKLWVNGKAVGQRSGFGVPHVYDISDLVDRSGDNYAALEIHKAVGNEEGTGGLLWPGFIFSGPTIDEPEAKPEERVLPGGGVEKVVH